MTFFYVLYSSSLKKYYTGISVHPDIRSIYHNAGKSGSKSAFTKRVKDWELIWTKEFQTKLEALRFEKFVKAKKSSKYIQKLTEHSAVIPT